MMSQTRQGDKGRLMTTKSFLSMMMIVSVLSVVTVGLVPNVEAFSNPTLYPIRINTVRTMTASSSSSYKSLVDVPSTTSRAFHLKHQPRKSSSSSLLQAGVEKSNDAIEIDTNNDSNEFDIKTTVAIVGGQSLLIVGAIIIATLIGTPNYGLGPNFALTQNAFNLGILYTLPLGVISVVLDKIENKFPSLQDVTKATNRSVLALLGGKFKPLVAIITAIGLGLAAGIGEEMLFRGILQYEINTKFGISNLIAVVSSSIIFGILHAVTPLYAILATLASFYFGFLYLSTGNLLVPIVTHGFYDFCALFYAHWTVSKMTSSEKDEIANWEGPLGSGLDD